MHLSRVPPRLPPALVTQRGLSVLETFTLVLLASCFWTGRQPLCLHLPKPEFRFSVLSTLLASGNWIGNWTQKGNYVPFAPSCLFPGMFGFSVFIPQRKHPQGSSRVSPDALPPCPLVLVNATRPDVCHLSQSSGCPAESMPVLLPCAWHTVGAQ